MQAGGIYVNNRRATDPATRVTRADAIGGRLLILRKGQREQRLVRLV